MKKKKESKVWTTVKKVDKQSRKKLQSFKIIR